jgi:hypothetical protein
LPSQLQRWRPRADPSEALVERSRESVSALRTIFAAIKAGNAAQAEMLGRKETAQAAAEVMRLLSD